MLSKSLIKPKQTIKKKCWKKKLVCYLSNFFSLFFPSSSFLSHPSPKTGILAKVRHPNCVSMLEIFESSKYLYVVMELVTGGELFAKICSEKSFSEADAARMISELCEGLRYLHSLGFFFF